MALYSSNKKFFFFESPCKICANADIAAILWRPLKWRHKLLVRWFAPEFFVIEAVKNWIFHLVRAHKKLMPTATAREPLSTHLPIDHATKSPNNDCSALHLQQKWTGNTPFSASHERIQTMNQTRTVVGVEKIIPAKQPIASKTQILALKRHGSIAICVQELRFQVHSFESLQTLALEQRQLPEPPTQKICQKVHTCHPFLFESNPVELNVYLGPSWIMGGLHVESSHTHPTLTQKHLVVLWSGEAWQVQIPCYFLFFLKRHYALFKGCNYTGHVSHAARWDGLSPIVSKLSKQQNPSFHEDTHAWRVYRPYSLSCKRKHKQGTGVTKHFLQGTYDALRVLAAMRLYKPASGSIGGLTLQKSCQKTP